MAYSSNAEKTCISHPRFIIFYNYVIVYAILCYIIPYVYMQCRPESVDVMNYMYIVCVCEYHVQCEGSVNPMFWVLDGFGTCCLSSTLLISHDFPLCSPKRWVMLFLLETHIHVRELCMEV